MNKRSMWLSALIAGLGMAALGNLPFVNLVNCILCLWVWLGGAASVLLYRRFQAGQPGPTTGQGAGLGALAGVVGAVIGTVIYFATAQLSAPIMDSLAKALNVGGGAPFAVRTPGDYVTQTLIFFAFDLVLYPLFGALGGLVTVALTKPKT